MELQKFDLKNKRILDIGATAVDYFCTVSDKVYGLTNVEGAVFDELIAKGIEVVPTLSQFDGDHIPFNKKFDFIYGPGLTQFISRERARWLIYNCCNQLEEGGLLVFEVSKSSQGKEYYDNQFKGYYIDNSYTLAKFTEMIESLAWPEMKVLWIEQGTDNMWVCITRRSA